MTGAVDRVTDRYCVSASQGAFPLNRDPALAAQTGPVDLAPSDDDMTDESYTPVDIDLEALPQDERAAAL